MVEQAYEGAQVERVTDIQVIGFFLYGLCDRNDQKTLQEAMDLVRAAFDLQQRFQLRMGRHCFAPFSNVKDPMEVDHHIYQRIRRYDDGRLRPKQTRGIIDEEDLN